MLFFIIAQNIIAFLAITIFTGTVSLPGLQWQHLTAIRDAHLDPVVSTLMLAIGAFSSRYRPIFPRTDTVSVGPAPLQSVQASALLSVSVPYLRYSLPVNLSLACPVASNVEYLVNMLHSTCHLGSVINEPKYVESSLLSVPLISNVPESWLQHMQYDLFIVSICFMVVLAVVKAISISIAYVHASSSKEVLAPVPVNTCQAYFLYESVAPSILTKVMSHVDGYGTTGYRLYSFSVTADDAADELTLDRILSSSASLDNLPGNCPVDHVRLSDCDKDLLESTVNMSVSGRLGDSFSVVDEPFQILPGSSSIAVQILALSDAESLVEHSLTMSVVFESFDTTLPPSFNGDTELAPQTFENSDHSTCLSPSHWTCSSTVSVDPTNIRLAEGGDDGLLEEQAIVVQIQEDTPVIADPSDQLDDAESTEHVVPQSLSEISVEFSCDFFGVMHSSLANECIISLDSPLGSVGEFIFSDNTSADGVIDHDIDLDVTSVNYETAADANIALRSASLDTSISDLICAYGEMDLLKDVLLSDVPPSTSFDDDVALAVAQGIVPLLADRTGSKVQSVLIPIIRTVMGCAPRLATPVHPGNKISTLQTPASGESTGSMASIGYEDIGTPLPPGPSQPAYLGTTIVSKVGLRIASPAQRLSSLLQPTVCPQAQVSTSISEMSLPPSPISETVSLLQIPASYSGISLPPTPELTISEIPESVLRLTAFITASTTDEMLGLGEGSLSVDTSSDSEPEDPDMKRVYIRLRELRHQTPSLDTDSSSISAQSSSLSTPVYSCAGSTDAARKELPCQEVCSTPPLSSSPFAAFNCAVAETSERNKSNQALRLKHFSYQKASQQNSASAESYLADIENISEPNPSSTSRSVRNHSGVR